MNNFAILLSGDIQRMAKYHIIGASIVVAFIWIAVLHFTAIEDVGSIFPMLLFLDATMMSMLLVGVAMFFEKQENVLKTMLVSPITKSQYLGAKIGANLVSNLITLVLLVLYASLFKEMNVSIPRLFGVVILVSIVHSIIGVLITYRSIDFTTLLTGVMKYSFIFVIPVILEQVGFIQNPTLQWMLYILPTKSAMTLLNSAVMEVGVFEVGTALGYLSILALFGFWFMIRQFDTYAVKESGA